MTIKHINKSDVEIMPARARAKFINSLSGFKSANLIATQNKEGHTNVAIFSSVVHLGASPALVGFIMRPDNNDRHTLNNILQTKSYTINQVSSAFYHQAHQTSAHYKSHQSEFDEVGLSPLYIENITAPFVKESPLKYAVTLKEILPINLNGTQMVIGEITDVLCNETSVKEDGYIDIETLQTVCISGLDSYHTSQRLTRLSYAKPNITSSAINPK